MILCSDQHFVFITFIYYFCVVCQAESVPYCYPDFTIGLVDVLYLGLIKY